MATFEPRLDTSFPLGLCKELCVHRKNSIPDPPKKTIQDATQQYKSCSRNDRTSAIKTLLLILQHFKHCPLQNSPLYWRYTVPNASSIVGMLPRMHFL